MAWSAGVAQEVEVSIVGMPPACGRLKVALHVNWGGGGKMKMRRKKKERRKQKKDKGK